MLGDGLQEGCRCPFIAGLRQFVARISMYGDELCFVPRSQSLRRLDLMLRERGGKEVDWWGPGLRSQTIDTEVAIESSCRAAPARDTFRLKWHGREDDIGRRWLQQSSVGRGLESVVERR
jgi:hypothetical protein